MSEQFSCTEQHDLVGDFCLKHDVTCFVVPPDGTIRGAGNDPAALTHRLQRALGDHIKVTVA